MRLDTSLEVPVGTNERLRGSLASAGLRPADLAEAVQVDSKTVERWITKGRMPHRLHRVAAAKCLAVEEAYLWPELVNDPLTQTASQAELLHLYPTRGAVSTDTWNQLFAGSHEAIDVLFYAGTHLFENDLIGTLARKAAEGVHCRVLIGDETSEAVRLRAVEEGTTGGLEGRVQLHRLYLRALRGIAGIEVRAHGTTLYNSLYRFDQDLMVNTHAFGAPAGLSPFLHFRRVPGGRLWDHYMQSFDEVWKRAEPEE
jgi:hypothetical protein